MQEFVRMSHAAQRQQAMAEHMGDEMDLETQVSSFPVDETSSFKADHGQTYSLHANNGCSGLC